MDFDPIVYAVDDEPAVLASLESLLESVGLTVKCFDSAQAFIDGYDPAQPGCLLLDVRMPDMSGPDLQEYLQAKGINLPIIMISAHGDVPLAVKAMKQGAVDFLEKPFRAQQLLDCVKSAMRVIFENRDLNARRGEIKARLLRLSNREREVMDHLVAGKPNKKIALELGLSERTVEKHRLNVLRKTRACNVVDLVRLTHTPIEK